MCCLFFYNPLLYAAKQAIGPRQLNDSEALDTARRAFKKNPKLSSEEIGKAIGRARRTVDSYISDLKAAIQMAFDITIFKMNRLGVPQERIADRLAVKREKIRDHLAKLAMLPNSPNSDLQKGFTVAQVAEKHGWPESLLWSIKLESRDDIAKCHELKWGIRTWDNWYWTDCDRRFGDELPGRIPAKLIAPRDAFIKVSWAGAL